MKKNSAQWLLGLSTGAILFLLGLLINPALTDTVMFGIVCGHLILDSIVFFIVCGILQKFKEMAFWQWAVYIALTTAIGMWTPLWGLRLWSYHPLLWASLMAPAFVGINVCFWKIAFKTTTRQAWLWGCIITCFNVYAYLLGTPILK